MTKVDSRQCDPCFPRLALRSLDPSLSPCSSPCQPVHGDPEGQHAHFRTKHEQVIVVQDADGLLIQYTKKKKGFCPLWARRTKRQEELLQIVPDNELLCARHLPIRSRCAGLPGHSHKHFLELQMLKRRHSRPWQWSLQRLKLETESLEQAKYWGQQISQRLQAQPHRPRQLLVFVNPYGGRQKARVVWKKISAPVFAAACVQCQVIETTCQGHAEGFIKGLSLQQLQQLDGIVAVGGDGMFSELLTGVLQHTHLSAALRLRLAHIPAGSTDAVACTLHGTRDPLTATLHVAFGDCTPLDVARLVTIPPVVTASAGPSAAEPLAVPAAETAVCGVSSSSDTLLLESVSHSGAAVASAGPEPQQQGTTPSSHTSFRHQKRHKQQQQQRSLHKQQQPQQQLAACFQPELRHFVCVANYGFLGDVMETSERLRWLGPVRYDIAGALRWLLLRGYKATVWYRPAAEPKQQELQQQEPVTRQWQQQHDCLQQQQQHQYSEPIVGPTILAPLLHHPHPSFHASTPAYEHQHGQHTQQCKHHCSNSTVSRHSSSSESNSRSSFEVHQPGASSSGASSLQLSPERSDHEGTSRQSASDLERSGVCGPDSCREATDASGSSSSPDSEQFSGGGAAKHVSFDPVVYARAGSVSSITSDAVVPKGLGSRASSIGSAVSSSSSNRCHSRCLLCGAASLQRISRSSFLAESQQRQLDQDSNNVAGVTAAAAEAAATADSTGSRSREAMTAATDMGMVVPTAHAVTQQAATKATSSGVRAAVNQGSASADPGPSWVKVEGTFSSIMCVVTSCRSDKSKAGLLPEAHLSDGRLALVLVEKRSRLQYLRFLVKLASTGIVPDMLPFVRVTYVTDVQVQTEGRQSSWNVDGELLKNSRVAFGVHAGLVDVFARGVELS